jgi:hypothetical protein
MSTIDTDTLEAALTGAPGADPELSALVREVRAQAPRMTPDFAERLEARALPARPRAARWQAALTPGRLLPALAAFAVLAVVATAALTLGGAGTGSGEDDSASSSVIQTSSGGSSSSASSAGGAAGARPPAPADRRREELNPAAGSLPRTAAPAPLRRLKRSRGTSNAFAAPPRKVQRDADLTLTTAPRDVQDVADRVVSTTQDVDGVVARSSVDVGDGGGSALFTLRIPTRRLDDALERLSDLAHVGSLRQGSTDITGSFVSAADRLSDARAERRALLKALGKATTANAISSLRQRIRFNRSEIGALKGDLQALRRRADLATVSVRITGSGAAKDADKNGGAWTPGDAAHDAVRVLEVAAGVILVASAVVVPLALLALLAALAARVVRRRGREQALDSA